MAKNGKKAVLECLVEFGGVSVGQTTARIGVRINRDHCELSLADEVFCGHRLDVRVILGKSDEMPNQKKAFESAYECAGAADVKHMGVNADTISTGLTFSLKEIKIEEFARFSKGAGRLVVYGVGELPDDAPSEHDEGDEFGNLKFDGDPRDAKLERLFSGQILKGLLSGGLDTVGALGDFTAANKDLTKLKGIGPEKKEVIINRLAEFFKANA